MSNNLWQCKLFQAQKLNEINETCLLRKVNVSRERSSRLHSFSASFPSCAFLDRLLLDFNHLWHYRSWLVYLLLWRLNALRDLLFFNFPICFVCLRMCIIFLYWFYFFWFLYLFRRKCIKMINFLLELAEFFLKSLFIFVRLIYVRLFFRFW